MVSLHQFTVSSLVEARDHSSYSSKIQHTNVTCSWHSRGGWQSDKGLHIFFPQVSASRLHLNVGLGHPRALGARMAGTQARCSDHIPGTSGTRKSTHSCQEHLPVIHFVYGLNEKLRHLLSSYHFLSYPSLLAKATDATNAYKCYVASRKGFQGISSISRDVFHPKKSG